MVCPKRNFINKPHLTRKFAGSVTMDLKKLREATRQATATLATIIVPVADAMPYKICTLATGEKVVEKVLPTCTKCKDMLLDVNAVDEKAGLEPISLSKLSAIKKANFSRIHFKKTRRQICPVFQLREIEAPSGCAYDEY